MRRAEVSVFVLAVKEMSSAAGLNREGSSLARDRGAAVELRFDESVPQLSARSLQRTRSLGNSTVRPISADSCSIACAETDLQRHFADAKQELGGTVRGQHHIAAVGWQRLCPQGMCPVRASFLAIHLDRQPETIDVKGISHQRADTAISRLFSGAQSFAPVSSPPNGTTMHPPNTFRVHSILPQLALDGAIIRLDQVRSTCRSCGLRSSMTRGAGFETDQKGTTLTCPACGATGLMDEMEIWHHWLEQCRRQQLLARSKQMIHSISRTRSE